MTYLYGFTKYAGSDKIWKIPGKLKAGDLFFLGDEYFLSLGDDISFFEQYVYEINEPESKFQIVEKKFLSNQTIEFINYMVYQRYAPYYNVMKYFLPQEIDKLVERKIGKKKIKFENDMSFGAELNATKNLINISEVGSSLCSEGKLSRDGQTLIIFPDLWTLRNMTDDDFTKQAGVDVLLSTNTQNQKDKSWRNIKNGNTKVVFATHSEIFQNYNDLKKIIIIFPHKRYYTNQQDPRYKTHPVVQKMSEIYGCELVEFEN